MKEGGREKEEEEEGLSLPLTRRSASSPHLLSLSLLFLCPLSILQRGRRREEEEGGEGAASNCNANRRSTHPPTSSPPPSTHPLPTPALLIPRFVSVSSSLFHPRNEHLFLLFFYGHLLVGGVLPPPPPPLSSGKKYKKPALAAKEDSCKSNASSGVIPHPLGVRW